MAPLNEESVQEVAVEEKEVELTPEQKKEQLSKLMSDGKRELKASNFDTACQKFGEAAEFAEKHYGPLTEESFEPNFMYGRTLAEIGSAENELFESALVNIVKKERNGEETEERDGDESMTEEEKEGVREMVAEALTENAEELEKKQKEADGTEEESKDEEMKEEKTEGTEEESKVEEVKEEKSADEGAAGDKAEESVAEDKKEEDEKAEEGAADDKKGENEEAADNEEEKEGEAEGESDEKEDIEGGEEEDEAEDEEEADNNQLAWETLEVASRIADKMIEETGSAEWKRKRADVFVQLAQCSVNDEKYDTALEDLGRARALMDDISTGKGDRLVAEVHFHEGRINRLRNEFALAEEAFNKGVGVFQSIFDGIKSEAGENPTEEQTAEMKELDELIKDFKERAEDCKGSEVQKKMVADLNAKEKAETPSILTSSNANSDPTVNDISLLVRKKRAHDDSEVEGAPKKAKSEGAEEKGEENIAV